MKPPSYLKNMLYLFSPKSELWPLARDKDRPFYYFCYCLQQF